MDISGFENILKQFDNKNKDNESQSSQLADADGGILKDYDIQQLTNEVFEKSSSAKHDFKKTINTSSIHSGHRQRARERFLLNPKETSDYDLLELLLFFIIPRADTKPIAKMLIDKYKTIRNVFNANIDELNNFGVNGSSLKYLLTIMSVFNQRMIQQDLKDKTKITNMSTLIEYCKSTLGFLQEEEFHIVFLDAQLNFIDDKKFGLESISGVSLSFRDILKKCIDIKAKSAVLYHNHPTGEIKPSIEDIKTTEKVVGILKQIDVDVIDHIIIGGDEWFSFKQHDLI